MWNEMTTISVSPQVLTVHEIGRVESDFMSPECDFLFCGIHFVRFAEPIRRNILTTSIKSIENFECPVMEFYKCRCSRWNIFGKDKWKWRKTEIARGCAIRFLDGDIIFVKEMESTIKEMIASAYR
jgi:hypothetical protein